MIKKNRLDRIFGPAGTAAGQVLIMAGVVACFYSIYALILVLLGAFVGYSGTGTLIDFDNKKIKFYHSIFGLIPLGEWIELSPDMMLGLTSSNQVYKAYSMSNRALSISDRDTRIVLFGSDRKIIMPVMKFPSSKEAANELQAMASKLGLGTV